MAGTLKKRIALVTNRLGAYSETFIQAQIDWLKPVLLLHDGNLPTMNGGLQLINQKHRNLNLFSQKVFKKELITLESRLVSVLKKNYIDLVLVQYGPAGVAMLPVCKKAKLSLIVHFHGFDASHKKILEKYKDDYLKLFDYAKAIIVVSEVMYEQVKSLGCPETKLVLNHYGVNDIFFNVNPSFRGNIFCTISRFVEKKGQVLTIQAFYKVVLKFPDARLYMAGNGPLLEDCKSLVRTLNLEKNIFFPGVLKHEMVPALMEKSLAFLQHSIIAQNGDSEGTPVSILEASASALPVIATRHAGITDVVLDGVTGILIDEKDTDGMAIAVINLINDKSLARKLGESGRQRVKEHFTMARYFSVLENIINL